MDALEGVIQQERGFWRPETNLQLLRYAVVRGAGRAVLAGTAATGFFFAMHLAWNRIAEQGLGAKTLLRVSIVEGCWGGSGGAIAFIAILLLQGKRPVEKSARVRTAALKVAIGEQESCSETAKRALESVTPSRLIRDLHNAIQNESTSIWRNRAMHSLRAGGVTGLVVGALVVAIIVDPPSSIAPSPLDAVKLATMAGVGCSIIAAISSLRSPLRPVEEARPVINAKNWVLHARIQNLEMEIATEYALQIPADEWHYQAVTKKVLGLS
jgi:hypothetical protein